MFDSIFDHIKLLVKGLILRFNLAGEVKSYISTNQFGASDGITSKKTLLGLNKFRQGFIIYNNSNNSIRIAFSSNAADLYNFTVEIGAHSDWIYIPTAGAYRGEITFNPSVSGSGMIIVTELVNELNTEVDL
jgi:hypothetical protein